MAITKNTALRNLQGDALGDAFNDGTLQIRTGAKPASANSAATGTLLATIVIPNNAFGAAASGVIDKAGTWSVVAIANGVAGWARFISSDTLKVMDMTVSETVGDLIINDENVVIGGVVTVTSLAITIPSGE